MSHAFIITSLQFAIPPVFIALIPVAAFAQAGPPLITDDPGTPGNGKWEINVAYSMEKSRLATQYETPLLDMNYGIGDRIQLKFEFPLLLLDEPGGGAKVGIDDSLLGMKYRFLDEEGNGISASFYPQLSLNSSAKSVDENLVESGTNLFLPVELSRSFGKLKLGMEVGYQFLQHDRNQWELGFSSGYPVTEKLEVVAELFGQGDAEFRRGNDLIFNFGARWSFSEHAGLLFAVGRSLYDRRDSAQLLVYSGVQFRF